MAKYNFEDKDFGETVRVDDINKKVAQIENGSLEKAQDVLEEDDLKRGVQSVLPQNSQGLSFNAEHKEHTIDFRDGVPSRGLERIDGSNLAEEQTEDKRRKKHKKSKKKAAYLCGLAAMIVVCLIGLFLRDREKIGQMNQQQAYANMTPDQTTIKFEALIRTITSTHNMFVYDITNDRRLTLELDSNTVYQDAEGRDGSFLDFYQGDIIHVEMKSEGNKAVRLEKKKDQWEKESLTDLNVDIKNHTLKIGEDLYSFSEETLFVFNGKFVDPATILPVDTVSVSGVGTQVWKVYINTYHGYLDLRNSDKVKNGKVTIDSAIAFAAEQKGKIPISAGVHKITVSGDNIDDFPMEIYIAPSETYELDLNDLQTRNGVLSINANADVYQLQIDGRVISSPDEPQVLEFGRHQITVLADGYEPWQQEVSLYQSALQVSVQLVPYVKMGTLNVTVEPEKAQVFIDGKLVGISPISVKLKYGTYALRVEKDGYLSAETMVNISEEKQNTLIVIAEDPEKKTPAIATPSVLEDGMQTKNGRKPKEET